MIQKGKSYVYGTVAEKLEYDDYKENTVLKAKKVGKSNSRVKLKLLFNITIVFALCFTVMYRYAVITELNYNLNKTYKGFNEMKNENSRLKFELEKDTDLVKVKELAEKRLGMQKPDKFQFVYVNVPKSDFTKVADAYKDRDRINNNIFVAVLNKVEKLTHLLY